MEIQYKKPENMRNEDVTSKFAFVTFMMMNDSFLPGALMLAYGLRKGNYDADLVCMVTEKISKDAKDALAHLYDHIVEVEELFISHRRRQERQDRPFLFTRFHSLRLGIDGDLGFKYEKIVVLDSDVFPQRYYDHLFTLNTPAGIVNERREYCMEYDNDGKYIIPEALVKQGKWKWHTIYDDVCPHGSKIPSEICKRVTEDPTNMGVNSSILVLTPSMEEFHAIMEDVKNPEVMKYVGDIFNWPEMQYATMRWSGKWTSIDLKFNGFGGYPSIYMLHGLHYAGFKPWSFNHQKKIYKIGLHKDFQFWYVKFTEMVSTDYPQLLKFKKVEKLFDSIIKFKEYIGDFDYN